jgi:hypothetical protein
MAAAIATAAQALNEARASSRFVPSVIAALLVVLIAILDLRAMMLPVHRGCIPLGLLTGQTIDPERRRKQIRLQYAGIATNYTRGYGGAAAGKSVKSGRDGTDQVGPEHGSQSCAFACVRAVGRG